MMINTPFLSLLFLLSTGLVTGLTTAMRRMGKAKVEALTCHQKGFATLLFKKEKRDQLIFGLTFTKTFLLIGYAVTALGFALPDHNFIGSSLLIVLIAFIVDLSARAISLFKPLPFLKGTLQIVSAYLLILWPLIIVSYKTLKKCLPETHYPLKDKILELLDDLELREALDPTDQKLILSMVTFKERIAREVMVPRIDMFTLSASTPVSKAVKAFIDEGYSRIPIWKENVDNIVGTLYYKDVLQLYTEPNKENNIETPIERLLKPIVYTPETKKISQLLQEFRAKHIHLAIVVDEYGGTEGIVTIEDILEELVGEIADEYDYDEELLYTPLPTGGWIIDAKMTILAIEDQLGVELPQSPEYETLGGYIFQKARTIPSKGWRLHRDNLDLEVLSSSERAIEKIRITPH